MNQTYTKQQRGLRVVLLLLAILGLGVLTLMVFTAYFPTWLGMRSFSYVVDSIVDASGWDRNLVRSVAVLFLLPFVWAISEIIRIGIRARIADAWRGEHSVLHRKRVAAVVLVLYISGFFAITYWAGRDANFGFSSGEARRFYAVTPEGIRTFPEDGNDPKYGIKLKPITPEIAESIERARRGLRPEPISRDRWPTLEFFDGVSGNPRVWYYQAPNGSYELFSSPGFHPRVGEPLRPATPQVADAAIRQALNTRGQNDKQRHSIKAHPVPGYSGQSATSNLPTPQTPGTQPSTGSAPTVPKAKDEGAFESSRRTTVAKMDLDYRQFTKHLAHYRLFATPIGTSEEVTVLLLDHSSDALPNVVASGLTGRLPSQNPNLTVYYVPPGTSLAPQISRLYTGSEVDRIAASHESGSSALMLAGMTYTFRRSRLVADDVVCDLSFNYRKYNNRGELVGQRNRLSFASSAFSEEVALRDAVNSLVLWFKTNSQ